MFYEKRPIVIWRLQLEDNAKTQCFLTRNDVHETVRGHKWANEKLSNLAAFLLIKIWTKKTVSAFDKHFKKNTVSSVKYHLYQHKVWQHLDPPEQIKGGYSYYWCACWCCMLLGSGLLKQSVFRRFAVWRTGFLELPSEAILFISTSFKSRLKVKRGHWCYLLKSLTYLFASSPHVKLAKRQENFLFVQWIMPVSWDCKVIHEKTQQQGKR